MTPATVKTEYNEPLFARPTYTTTQAARICHVATKTIVKNCNKGIIPCFLLPNSKHRRIHHQDLLTFMEEYNIPIPKEIMPAPYTKALKPHQLTEDTFAHQVRQYIIENDISYATLARITGYTEEHICTYVNGKNSSLRVTELLCMVLNVKLSFRAAIIPNRNTPPLHSQS